MNHSHRLILLQLLAFVLQVASAHAQEAAAEESGKRVQYQLVLPDEKTPESVKPEEHNPFESESEAQNRLAPGDTEENRVRDKLLKLPVVGTKRMEDGRMRVLLGDIILETGCVVPKVLPEQLVELRVKNITDQYIELAWQEKRATGLPPKLMIIPINIAPRIRIQLLGQNDIATKNGRNTNAVMDLPPRAPFPVKSSLPPNAPPPSKEVTDESIPVAPAASMVSIAQPLAPAPAAVVSAPPGPAAQLQKPVEEPPKTTPPSPSAAPAVESVVRMLFGTPAPAPK